MFIKTDKLLLSVVLSLLSAQLPVAVAANPPSSMRSCAIFHDRVASQLLRVEAHGKHGVRVRAVQAGGSFRDDLVSALVPPVATSPEPASCGAGDAAGGGIKRAKAPQVTHNPRTTNLDPHPTHTHGRVAHCVLADPGRRSAGAGLPTSRHADLRGRGSRGSSRSTPAAGNDPGARKDLAVPADRRPPFLSPTQPFDLWRGGAATGLPFRR